MDDESVEPAEGPGKGRDEEGGPRKPPPAEREKVDWRRPPPRDDLNLRMIIRDTAAPDEKDDPDPPAP